MFSLLGLYLVVGFVICENFFALKDFELYYDNIELLKLSTDDCNFQKLGKSEYDNFFSEQFIASDNSNKIIYVVGLQKNETTPGGPFVTTVIALDSASGKMIRSYNLDKFLLESYLGLESYAIEVDSDSGIVYVVGKAYDSQYNTKHFALSIDPAKNNVTILGEVCDGDYRIIASTWDHKMKKMYVAYSENFYVLSFNGGMLKVDEIPNTAGFETMDYDGVTNRIYGIKLNDDDGYMDQELYYYTIKEGKFEKVLSFQYSAGEYGMSTLDEKNRKLYVFVGTSHPHVGTTYHLMQVDIDKKTKSEMCVPSGCCKAIISTPYA